MSIEAKALSSAAAENLDLINHFNFLISLLMKFFNYVTSNVATINICCVALLCFLFAAQQIFFSQRTRRGCNAINKTNFVVFAATWRTPRETKTTNNESSLFYPQHGTHIWCAHYCPTRNFFSIVFKIKWGRTTAMDVSYDDR